MYKPQSLRQVMDQDRRVSPRDSEALAHGAHTLGHPRLFAGGRVTGHTLTSVTFCRASE